MRIGEPAWVVASFFPVQGKWTEEDYFRLEADRRIELVRGCIEVLPMPNELHQMIVQWLAQQLIVWNQVAKAGKVLTGPVPMKLPNGDIREPDVLMAPKAASMPKPAYPALAFFVVEIVSQGSEARRRYLVDKRADYANAGIPEYWIIDPLEKTVTVLKLSGATYLEQGVFHENDVAKAATLPGFSIDCKAMWDLEKEI